MTKILYSSQFEKSFRKIPENIAQLFNDKQSFFILNSFNPLLKTHKLKGKLKEYYSFSVNLEYRVIFKIVSKEKILFLDIGTHEIYKK
ncbi:MAG: type II toxin-antitoxin system mRNA interferase toxin, RelE/StbE family [Patescibacteria group bacterium]|uniref:Plasmid stabilization system n=1 Tax=Candidatus Roizmanbacteria bacterium GW2011_GWC2_34_23 TaxID=1618484 RepID=A0A0G0DJ04_9BACT|nr:MAG: Plasmid stabilization system [Candidatus Roizmanbacteria bacterium GW2011_GWC2_34_23]